MQFYRITKLCYFISLWQLKVHWCCGLFPPQIQSDGIGMGHYRVSILANCNNLRKLNCFVFCWSGCCFRFLFCWFSSHNQVNHSFTAHRGIDMLFLKIYIKMFWWLKYVSISSFPVWRSFVLRFQKLFTKKNLLPLEWQKRAGYGCWEIKLPSYINISNVFPFLFSLLFQFNNVFFRVCLFFGGTNMYRVKLGQTPAKVTISKMALPNNIMGNEKLQAEPILLTHSSHFLVSWFISLNKWGWHVLCFLHFPPSFTPQDQLPTL